MDKMRNTYESLVGKSEGESTWEPRSIWRDNFVENGCEGAKCVVRDRDRW